MSQGLYTQHALVKNPYEVFKNLDIEASQGLIGNYITPEASPNEGYSFSRIIAPGFINLHAHLAYTYSKASANNLFDWLADLTAEQFKAEKSCLLPQHISNARAAIASGTTCLVDNSSSPAQSIEAYKQTGLRGIIGIEVFGSDPALANEIFARKVEELNKLAARCNDRIELCFSPHATYDVSVKLWKLLLDWTRNIRHPERSEGSPQQGDRYAASRLTMTQHVIPLLLSHAAESEIEEEWFRDKDSKLANSALEFWQQINTLEPKLKHWQPYESSVAMLAENNLLDPCLLLTHLCCASDKDLRVLASLGVNLVTCPRSNAYLHNPRAHIDKWQSAYGIGTDSLASNYDWDLRREVNELKNLNAVEKLELLTTKPAKILNKNIGDLAIGKAADYTVFEVRHNDIDLGAVDPLELLFDTELCVPVETYIAGQLCYSAAPNATV